MTHEVRGDTTPLALAVPPPRIFTVPPSCAAVHAEHAACAVPAAAQRVMLSVRKGVKAMRVPVKAMRAAHVCYVVVFGVVVLRENARYLRGGRAPCASTLWRQRRSPFPPTSLPWPRQNSRA